MFYLVKKWQRKLYNNERVRAFYRTSLGRFLYHLPEEAGNMLSGNRHPMVPPMWKAYIGRGDFLAVGKEFLVHFVDLGNLRPQDIVLDLGCGMGRMAVALTGYLNASQGGRYEGIDVVREGIEWGRTRISSRFPNFHFQLADVYSDLYNPKGGHTPEEYNLPFDGATFDFVCLNSVFTHMPPGAVRNYLKEVSRVLKPSGTCFITWYLLNPESKGLIAEERSILAFRPRSGEAWSLNGKNWGDVAYEEGWVRQAYTDCGLAPQNPHFGSWCGRTEFLSGQDIVIARKAFP